jgi:outer membrane protein assembly factor BamB
MVAAMNRRRLSAECKAMHLVPPIESCRFPRSRRRAAVAIFVGLTLLQRTVVVAQDLRPALPPAGESAATRAALEDIATLDVGEFDWPQWGGSRLRNNTPRATNLPESWRLGRANSSRPDPWRVVRTPDGSRREPNPDWQPGPWRPPGSVNVLWVAELGSQSHGNPVVANGHVYVGTNNAYGYVERYSRPHEPTGVDLGVLLCLDERTGEFLWQYSSPKLPAGLVHDWPSMGICSTPLVDGNRLWLVTNRCELVCLDTEGFRDDENDGPYRDEPNRNADEADVMWKLDMLGTLGVFPHNMSACSPLAVGDRLFVCTSNGVDESHINIPAPDAPSFICVDRRTGEVLWTDNSPGPYILNGQWGSPSFGVLGGRPQVLFPGGDGWLYSFDPEGDGAGHAKLLWKFDANPKTSVYNLRALSTRSALVAFASICDGLVYLAVGDNPDHGAPPGHLWCIDPGRKLDGSDVSAELAVDARGNPLPRRRVQAVDPQAGEWAVPNPDSAVVWRYTGGDLNGNGKLDYEEEFHRSLSAPTVVDDIAYVPDFSGIVHCLDARTGKSHWTYDMFSQCWSSALFADGKVYVGNEQGNLLVFRHSADRSTALPGGKPLAEIDMRNSILLTPIVANNVLYVPTKNRLVAIGETDNPAQRP